MSAKGEVDSRASEAVAKNSDVGRGGGERESFSLKRSLRV